MSVLLPCDAAELYARRFGAGRTQRRARRRVAAAIVDLDVSSLLPRG
jgi:hypothetical protein